VARAVTGHIGQTWADLPASGDYGRALAVSIGTKCFQKWGVTAEMVPRIMGWGEMNNHRVRSMRNFESAAFAFLFLVDEGPPVIDLEPEPPRPPLDPAEQAKARQRVLEAKRDSDERLRLRRKAEEEAERRRLAVAPTFVLLDGRMRLRFPNGTVVADDLAELAPDQGNGQMLALPPPEDDHAA
jgi:hypothetical protein